MNRYHFHFDCRICGAEDIKTWCKARSSPDADLIVWMNTFLMPRVAQAHRAHSPRCTARQFDLKFHLPGNPEKAFIGEANDPETLPEPPGREEFKKLD